MYVIRQTDETGIVNLIFIFYCTEYGCGQSCAFLPVHTGKDRYNCFTAVPVKLTCTGTPILVKINLALELEVGKCLTCHTPLCPLCNCDHAMVSQLLGDLELVDFIAKCIHSICSLMHVYCTNFCTGTMILPMVVLVYRWYGTISKCTTLVNNRGKYLFEILLLIFANQPKIRIGFQNFFFIKLIWSELSH